MPATDHASASAEPTAHRGFEWVFEQVGPIHAPWQLKAAMQIPGIHRALGYAVGIGARPEHVRAEVPAKPGSSRLAKVVFAGIGLMATAAALGWAVSRVQRRAMRIAAQIISANNISRKGVDQNNRSLSGLEHFSHRYTLVEDGEVQLSLESEAGSVGIE